MIRLALLVTLSWLSYTSVATAACPRAVKHALADTGRAVVWYDGNRAYGCLRSSGRRVLLLDEDAEDWGMVRPRLAGRYVAFGVDLYDKYDSSVWIFRVELWDLRTGRRVRRKELDHLAPGWNPVLRRLELRATGSAAFSISGNPAVPSEVWLLSRTRTRRVDRGLGLDAGSLRRDDEAVTWTHDGARRTARLP